MVVRTRIAALAVPGLLAVGVLALALGPPGAAIASRPGGPQDLVRLVPVPTVDEAAGSRSTETAVLAGGCFWGVQGVFQHVTGVTNAVSGYAGGSAETAHYDIVGTGRTGHAESVAITFDPRVVSYGRLLQVFFSVVHDPTQLNRQGPDIGTEYRSTIFPITDEQERVARAYLAELDGAGVFDRPVVTTIERDRAFYPAEDYHQDFLVRNPTYPYIVVNDIPKVQALARLFPNLYRDPPVLVADARP